MRKSPRISLNAEVLLRRRGQNNFRVRIYDVSLEGCRIEFVERPKLDERIWVKFEGLQALEASVCWIEGHAIGAKFEKPMHPAVFDLVVARINPEPR